MWWGYKLRKDLTRQKFGRLTALQYQEKIGKKYFWSFKCDCGKTVILPSNAVKTGNTRSCGCIKREEMNRRFTKHGHAPAGKTTPTYNSWYAMIQRCTNPHNKCWKNYGGAGVTVCKRWLVFKNFLADMGTRPENTTLGRYGDIGNYKPSNCAWQSFIEQIETKRRKRLGIYF
jgi:hypothetical protein